MTAPDDQRDPRFAAPQDRPPLDSSLAQPGERHTSTSAMVGLVLAIVGFCLWPLGILAAVLGMVGLSDIRRNAGRVTGDMLAWLAIIFGGLETLATIAAGVALTLGVFQGMKSMAGPLRASAAATMLEQIATGQRSMQAAAHIDADGDGVGEYGELADIDQFGGTQTEGIADPSASQFLGYRLHFVLPETTDEREEQWHAFLEPTAADGDLPWFYMDESSVLRLAYNVPAMPTRDEARNWEVTTSQTLAQELVEDRFLDD